MTRMQIQDYTFEIDLEKTVEYYKTHGLCDCDTCLRYYAVAKDRLPKLDAFLSKFGVDISRPDHVFSHEENGRLFCISVDYTVCGKIAVTGSSEIHIEDEHHTFIPIITAGFVTPNHQTSDYFTISLDEFYLPFI